MKDPRYKFFIWERIRTLPLLTNLELADLSIRKSKSLWTLNCYSELKRTFVERFPPMDVMVGFIFRWCIAVSDLPWPGFRLQILDELQEG